LVGGVGVVAGVEVGVGRGMVVIVEGGEGELDWGDSVAGFPVVVELPGPDGVGVFGGKGRNTVSMTVVVVSAFGATVVVEKTVVVAVAVTTFREKTVVVTVTVVVRVTSARFSAVPLVL
jgi:hypothetical protein